jgi:hypothetical protein
MFEKYAIVISPPKKVFYELQKYGLLTKEELENIDDRNFTFHAYNEDLAVEISFRIPQYLMLMKNLVKNIIKNDIK